VYFLLKFFCWQKQITVREITTISASGNSDHATGVVRLCPGDG